MKKQSISNDIQIEPLPHLPDGVLDAYKNRKLVIFVGAGISRLMGCQGWEQLSNSLIKCVCKAATANQIINSDLDSKAKITIARRYSEKNNREKEFWATFKKGITADKDKEDVYATISKLGGRFITTNCDGLLVAHFPYSFTTDCTRESFIEKEDQDYVFCIHGNYGDGKSDDQQTLVFTVEEYLRAYAVGSKLEEFLTYVLGDNQVLFIGYGLNEFEIISKAFRSNERIREKHYLLQGFFSYEQELANAEAEYYQSLGIKLIAYRKDENDYDQQKAVLDYWIEQLYDETPYASRNVQKVTRALQAYNEGNEKTLKECLGRKDAQGETNLRAILETLSTNQECFRWLKFLLDNGFIAAEWPGEGSRGQIKRSTITDLTLSCLWHCSIESQNLQDARSAIQDYVNNCLEQALKCTDSDSVRLGILLFVAVKYKSINMEAFWSLWKTWLPNAADQKLFLLERNLPSIKSWPLALQIRLLEGFFETRGESDKRIGYYWFEDAARIITQKIRADVRLAIFKNSINLVNTKDDNYTSMHSIKERLRYSSTEYDAAIYGVLEMLWKSFSQRKRLRLCKYMMESADSTYGYQIALHFARDQEYSSVKDFKNNPLSVRSTFVDFYLWLHNVIEKVSSSDIDILYKWILEANFGYEWFSDQDLQKEYTRRINTYRYQLMKLLVDVDDRYLDSLNGFALNADTEQSSPVEDEESHSSAQIAKSDQKLPLVIPDQMPNDELHELVLNAVGHSGWSDREYSYREVYSDLFKRITSKQLEGYSQYVLGMPANQSVYLIKELGQEAYLNKCGKTHVKNVLGRLKYLVQGENLDEHVHNEIGNSIVYILDKLPNQGWKYEEIFNFAVKLDPEKLWIGTSRINERMDYSSNIMNIPECRLFGVVIQAAANCSKDDKVRIAFKQWYIKHCRSPKQYLLLLTCAFYYRMLLILDMEWVLEVVLSDFRCQEYSDELALCLATRLNYISKDEAAFVTDEERLDRVICLIENKKVLRRNGEQFVTCIVAAHYFGYMKTLQYEQFLERLPNDFIRVVFNAIASKIQDGNIQKKKRELQKTYNTVRGFKGVDVSHEYLNAMSLFKSVDTNCWKLIEEFIPNISVDKQLWLSIESCLKGTKRKNKHIEPIIVAICKSANCVEEIGQFHFDSILYNLARLNIWSSVSELARLAVHLNYYLTKYSKYDESPEHFLNDFKTWYPGFC